ncbi:hypothetical protein [Micromonospora echinospora]|uniref:hypothetical protein n=1 Tax=Micromonospora echinospora TaxID=1877 RepID=UPI003A88207A
MNALVAAPSVTEGNQVKVFLVKPPIRGCMVEIGRHVPIGLAYVSSALRAAGHETEIFDSLAYTEDNHVVPDAELTTILDVAEVRP